MTVTKYADLVQETTTTTGTGDLTLAGAVVGFRTFVSAVTVGQRVPYAIAEGTNWEIGNGTLSASTTLQRTTILASSNAGSALNLAAGTKQVRLVAPAAFYQYFALPPTAPVTPPDAGTAAGAIVIGNGAFVVGPANRAVAIGDGASALSGSSVAIGESSECQAANSVAVGFDTTTTLDSGVAIGNGATAVAAGSIALGFAASGQNAGGLHLPGRGTSAAVGSHALLFLAAETTAATITNMSLSQGTADISLGTNKRAVYHMDLRVGALQLAGSAGTAGDSWGRHLTGLLKVNATGVITWLGGAFTVLGTWNDTNAAAWAVTLNTSVANLVRIQVTGELNKTIHWTASLMLTRVQAQ